MKQNAIIALAGNPNVGKSTVFNALTGSRQHTGNWAGKTVACACGSVRCRDARMTLVDLPGIYSLHARSPEEETARDFLTLEQPDCVILVADATSLERNLILALQILEITPHVVLCLNLMDEARRKGIRINISVLEHALGIPVIPCIARKKQGLRALLIAAQQMMARQDTAARPAVRYPPEIQRAIERSGLSPFAAINHLLDAPPGGITPDALRDTVCACTATRAEQISQESLRAPANADARDRRIDRIVLSRAFGVPLMLLLLALIFYLTLSGANLVSDQLSALLLGAAEPLRHGLTALQLPAFLLRLLVDGVWRVLATVVSVMLPPMAIFFPLFTLLEDAGYLPRVAFQLDHALCRAHACGKQSICMCMGLGCNACGITGCRIIESPHEKYIAILTNAFMPCNGRLPLLIVLLSLFCAGGTPMQALLLSGVIAFASALTLGVSRLLSATLLRGLPSSFALELPPYRVPQFGAVVVRSVFDRTLFVLGRAAVVAAPAGALIFLLANLSVGHAPILQHMIGFLDPAGRLLGMDGVILLAFLLAFPANELVMPLMLMGYLSTGVLQGGLSLSAFHALLLANGWTVKTVVCTVLFTLAHWPCSTTCLTVLHETKSPRWTLAAFLLPTLCGAVLCMAANALLTLAGIS